MSKYVDTDNISTSMGEYTLHILVDGSGEWIREPYMVLIEPSKDRGYMYIFQPSLFELGPSTVKDDIGGCEICGSEDSVSPCFRTTGWFDVETENVRDHFRAGHSTLCVECITEFEEFTMDTVPKEYSEYIVLERM